MAERWRTRRAYYQGVAALTAGNAPAAVAHFEQAIPLWGAAPEVDFHAAQAARRVGDYATAIGHLLEAERRGWNSTDLEIERALIAVQNGVALSRVEATLRAGMEGDAISAHDATTALGGGYAAQFRIVEAETVTAQWVARWPGDPVGWKLRADILERLVRRPAARDAYARWVDLAPAQREARLGLVRLLLETQAPVAEIVPHLEVLEAAGGAGVELLRYKARAQIADGRPEEAAATLDRAIAGPTPDAQALTERAKLDRDRGRPADAVAFARRAVAADPGNPEALYTLFQCLQQTGPAAEAAEVESRWKQTTSDLNRVNELAKQVSAAPFDPDLRREMGELFLRNGREREGLRWLDSALDLRSDHGPTHQVLARYYAQVGRPDLAAVHSRQVK